MRSTSTRDYQALSMRPTSSSSCRSSLHTVRSAKVLPVLTSSSLLPTLGSSMDSAPRSTHLLFSFFFLLSLSSAGSVSAENVTLDFQSFSIRSLTLLGDAYLRNGSVGLTRVAGVPSSSSGTALCNVPIRFYDPKTNTSACFSTRFSFSIMNPDPGSTGDGLTFFISPDNQTLGSTGAYLGVFNSSQPANDASIIAIEFDTFLNEGVGDPSPNHVGLDVGGPDSVMTADLGPLGIDLKSGNLITAWIDFHDDEKRLNVWLGYSGMKPQEPAMTTTLDLSRNFQEFMYVGFSASTEGSTEVHTVEDWSFKTFGFPEVNLSTHNVSDGSWRVIPDIPVSAPAKETHKKLGLVLGIAGPVALCVAFSVLVWVFLKKFIGLGKGDGRFTQELLKGPRQISYRKLSIATRGFHSSKIVGNGAFGSVYKAIDPRSGIAYAVKRSKHSRQGKSEFLAELSIIARLRHKNLVQLQGWCAEKDELLLVYEFMPNGSLDKVLYEGHESGMLSTLKWPCRYNIATGIASVLVYLHQECEQQVIHRDIKTSNIMLDANFNARLGDFGLARLMDHNKSPDSTLTAGTMGYLAPEYVQYGKATEKTDVFSFGVVMLEVCCGRRPIEKHNGDAHNLVNLVDWVWSMYSENQLIQAADPRLNGEFDKDEMMRLLLVGLSCVNPNYNDRPSMRRVLQILNLEAEPMVVPRMKPFPIFSCSLPWSLQDIVSDNEESTLPAPL